MNDLNPIQMSILKYLLFNPKSRFTKLNEDKVPTDLFSYHLKKLIEMKFVNKEENLYSLTRAGKEFANRMDTDNNKIEKQPKVSVLIVPFKKIGKITKYLIQRRLKEPYYGYLGFMTGKIRYGETISEAAERELAEETGFSATFKYVYTLHEMVYSTEGEILEDKFFNVVEASSIKGKLVNAQGSESLWVTEKEFYEASPKYHNEEDIYEWYKSGDKSFKEHKYYIEKF